MEAIKFAKQEYIARICSTKTLVLLFLQAYVIHIYLKPVIRYAEDVNYPPSPWCFPFLFSNIYFLLLFILGMIYFFSDVPFMQYRNMYQVIRTGRKTWAVGEILSITFQSVFIMVFQFLVSILCLLGHCRWETGWGKLYHTAALTNADEYYGFLFYFPYEAIQKWEPFQLIVFTLFMGTLVLSFLGILMYTVSLFLNRTIAVTLGVFIAVMIFIVEGVHPLIRAKTAMFSPASYLMTALFGTKIHDSPVLPTINYMITVLVTGILFMAMFIIWNIKKVEFEWSKED